MENSGKKSDGSFLQTAKLNEKEYRKKRVIPIGES